MVQHNKRNQSCCLGTHFIKNGIKPGFIISGFFTLTSTVPSNVVRYTLHVRIHAPYIDRYRSIYELVSVFRAHMFHCILTSTPSLKDNKITFLRNIKASITKLH